MYFAQCNFNEILAVFSNTHLECNIGGPEAQECKNLGWENPMRQALNQGLLICQKILGSSPHVPIGIGGHTGLRRFDISCGEPSSFAVKLLSPKSQSNENGVRGEIWRRYYCWDWQISRIKCYCKSHCIPTHSSRRQIWIKFDGRQTKIQETKIAVII